MSVTDDLPGFILEHAQRDLRSLATLLHDTAERIERYADDGATQDLRTLRPTIAPMVNDSVRALMSCMGNAGVRIPIRYIEEYADAVRAQEQIAPSAGEAVQEP